MDDQEILEILTKNLVEGVALTLAKESGINDWFKSAPEFENEARASITAVRDYLRGSGIHTGSAITMLNSALAKGM